MKSFANENTLAGKINLLTEIEQMYEQRNHRVISQLLKVVGNDIYIPILKLKKTPNASSFLFEYLSQYNFNGSQVEDILASLDGPSG